MRGMKQACKKLDRCYKIKMVLDKEMLDEQYREAIKNICSKCKERES